MIHKAHDPGLLERVYEVCMEHELIKRGLKVERQVVVPIEYDGHLVKEALKRDILVNELVIIE